jgi:hypothetical protein
LNGIVSPPFTIDPVAVIVEPAERDQLGERLQAADMVAMPMADHHVVDLLQACLLRGGENALRVPVAVPRIAGVEQQ